MAMNDEETVALIAGGHTFGKAHGAGSIRSWSAPSRKPRHRRAGPGLENAQRQRQGGYHHQRHRGRLEAQPDALGQRLLRHAVRLRMGTDQSPAGAHQWKPRTAARAPIPDAHDPAKKHAPMMTTADLALRFDPAYEKISRRFHPEPAGLRRRLRARLVQTDHRDMGPRARYLGPEAGAEGKCWSGRTRCPRSTTRWSTRRTSRAEGEGAGLGPATAQLVRPPGPRPPPSAAATSAAAPTARASACAAEGLGRQPAGRAGASVLQVLEGIRAAFNASRRRQGLAGRPDRAGRRRRHRGGAQGRPATTWRCPSRRGAPTRRRSRPTPIPSPCSSRRPTASATSPRPGRAPRRPSAAGRQGAAARPGAPGDDGAGRRPARARRQCQRSTRTAYSPRGPAC